MIGDSMWYSFVFPLPPLVIWCICLMFDFVIVIVTKTQLLFSIQTQQGKRAKAEIVIMSLMILPMTIQKMRKVSFLAKVCLESVLLVMRFCGWVLLAPKQWDYAKHLSLLKFHIDLFFIIVLRHSTVVCYRAKAIWLLCIHLKITFDPYNFHLTSTTVSPQTL